MKKRQLSSFAVPALLAILALAGCRTTGPTNGCPTWTYANQAEWGLLCPAYRECAGLEQSPRPLTSRTSANLPLIDPRYAKSPFLVKNNRAGYTIEAKPKPSGTENRLVIGDDTYTLDEIHFHNSSEHLLPGPGRPGGSFPVEIHFVHHNVKNEKELAVIGVFMVEERGAPNNPVFEQILENVDKDEIQMDPVVLLPLRLPRLDYRYLGSKTTPPCTQGVRWHVLAEPIVVPPIQVEALRRFHRDNKRDPQRNGQPVFEPKPGAATPTP
ncbi:MAG TPA: carbonic anhydrase family protein [Thermoanaerobaculia bacterium]|nr:carbonic anhydrase family protein [Thermoanaerobaculia bacterium]